MSEPALFAAPEAEADPVGAAPVERVNEAHMIDLLVRRYTRVSMDAHRYAFADHVADRPGFANRIADFLAVDCYSQGPWESRRHEIHGHEIKVRRADWLTEMRDPEKAEAFKPYCHRWWLVVARYDIVKPGELPIGWGLMAKVGGQLRAVTRAPLLDTEPMPPAMTASFLRATAKTARRIAAAGPYPVNTTETAR